MRSFPLWRIIAIAVGVLILAHLAAGSLLTSLSPSAGVQMTYTEFLNAVDQHKVGRVLLRGNEIEGRMRDGGTFSVWAPEDPKLVDRLLAAGVRVDAGPPSQRGAFLWMLVDWIPILLLIGVWIWAMRRQMGGGGGAGGPFAFAKSRARMLRAGEGRITFDDVAGIEEAKQELDEIVEFLRDPAKFQRLGGRIPRGVLLSGNPGTGKTLLARAIAGEANVPFFSATGSDFVEMFVGVGASRVRDMFEQARKNAPCLLFIDEIDAVGRHRGAGMGGGHDEREQTLNQILVEMDGFSESEGVIIIAATNRPDVLDPALLRPGRFDRQVVVPLPDVRGRTRILQVHTRKLPLAPDFDAAVIARGTPGFSGAQLASLANEAALLAARRNLDTIGMAEFEEAKDKVMMGVERRSMVMKEEERRIIAFHEAGHALVSRHCPASDPIHKATIVPRGRALGMVMRLPETDRLSLSREKLEADMAVGYGGRVAEELVFGVERITTGAANDLRQITGMARRMVCEWGLSDSMGFVAWEESSREVFLGLTTSENKLMSEETARQIDDEVRRIAEAAEARARQILTTHIDHLHRLAEALLERETLSGGEIDELLADELLADAQPVA